MAFLARNWFLIGIFIAVAAGLAAPQGGLAIRATGVVLPSLVATVLWISGLNLDTSRLRAQALNLRAIGLTLLSTYAVAPAAGWMLATLLAPGGDELERVRFIEAVLIAAAQAGTVASALALTVLAGGDHELALVLTVLSNGLTAVLTPLALEIALGREVELPFFAMCGRMALVVLLPVVVGQICRRLAWGSLRRLRRTWSILPRLIVLSFLYTGSSSAAEHLGVDPALAVRFLLATGTLHGVLVAFTWGSSRLLGFTAEARAAVVFCGSQKTLPNGLYLWDRFFPTNPWGAVPLVLYHVLQLFLDTLLVPRLAARGREECPDEASERP